MGLVRERRQTRQIKVGSQQVGSDVPVSVQSMTNTQTQDAPATIGQILSLEKAGCEIVRVAVPDMEAARTLGRIKEAIHIPLIADIHFDYRLALAAAEAGVDGLRINPGNIGEEKKIKAVVDCAKAHHLPIRVGVNAGSLEKGIEKKYGATPTAMKESALANIRTLEDLGFYDIKVSLKASDVERTVEAYRMLAPLTDVPFHVGVTEAGGLYAGITKSAIGIGMLLSEGIGDTIRVSLTRDPVEEIRTGYEILRALGLRHHGPELISCPTCGRCKIDLFKIAEATEKALLERSAKIKVAIMGCVVNGPGEAKEADIGIAGGDGTGILFKKGKVIRKIHQDCLVEELLNEIDLMTKDAEDINGKKVKTAITPTREEDYAQWYQEVVKASDMAENSPVRGCMVIKPWGFAIWENIQRQMDDMFKETGVKNAYFPLFIPLSYLEKEAEHVEGFAKECAVVTHHKLEKDENGGLRPAGELAEPLIVRPTSETIIGESMSKWTSSYRDLPILINQWANVVRWEMRTRMFLRTSEFLWQEGHTAHATKEEAVERTHQMLDIYTQFVEEHLAMPVFKGRKSESERFPGADDTTCIEAMMQDKRALQAGTSHFLGQNFAKGSNISFQNEDGQEAYAWTTSWGTSTRMIGGMIMVHSDDDGLVVPPRVAPAHVVILPIVKKGGDNTEVLSSATALKEALKARIYHGRPVEVEIDDRDIGGARGWDWVKKGIPVRIELGPRDIENNSVFMARRDTNKKEGMDRDAFVDNILDILDDIQNTLFQRALKYREENTFTIDDKDEFYTLYKKAKGYDNGAFVMSHWCGSGDCEEAIKKDLSVTIRCIPFDSPEEEGRCICCGGKSGRRVLFAKAY